MGCGPSTNAVSVTLALESSVSVRDHRRVERKKEEDGDRSRSEESGKGSKSFRLGNLIRYLEAEQIAAGWPVWLSSVAGEAIQGWVPLKAESFEKLEKIGQGTYSSVYKARDLDTGKIVALKKVRFDNFEPESVKFMAREIQILRRLDHPNVMKLEGLITSRLTCSMYLVFEYMEHDLAGLSSCPGIKFSESQIKCYMNQLLSGIDHCHSRGIIHRDIKCANLLINDEGILKIADFGLANLSNPGKQPLTSRVVTLWYRPPELLLGSTDYTSTVDIWSIGCVFAEMFLQKPIIQGKTEVEQLHKIFKLCGSPTEEYWKKTKLPHATIFKPHRPYESCLHETFKCLPDSAFRLLEILLSVEPDKRGTSSTALSSEYFRTEPYGCEPSSLPKYPPNKEIDANIREKLQRNMATGGTHEPEAIRRPSRTYRPSREPRLQSKLVARPEESKIKASAKGDNRLFVDIYPAAAIDHPTKNRRSRHDSHGDIPFSGPLNVTSSSGFAWAKRQSDDNPYIKVQSKCSSRDNHSDSKGQLNGEVDDGAKVLEQDDQFDSSNVSHSRNWSQKHGTMDYQDQGDRIEFSGPLLSQSRKVDEHLEKHERQIRQAVRRSWFKRGQKVWFPV